MSEEENGFGRRVGEPEWFWYEDEETKETVCADWPFFVWAAEWIRDDLGLSLGAAQVRLRHLCASGEVRSMKYDRMLVDYLTGDGVDDQDEQPQIIKPSEWLTEQIDLAEPWNIAVCVSQEDLRHWLKAQTKTPPVQGSPRPRDLAKQAVDALWPNGVPKSLVNKDIERAVADHMKANGLGAPSKETILRAAGKK
jgi:hypothetical protein